MLRGAKRDKFDPALDAFDVETARQLVLPLALALDYLHHKVRFGVRMPTITSRLRLTLQCQHVNSLSCTWT